jgi:HlyD family secretion protein
VATAVLGLGFLVTGIGGLAFGIELSGAVISLGTVIVDSHVKKVQHPTGGVVGEIRVRDGHHVRAGEVVIRLDPTLAAANHAIITKNLDELVIRQARLRLEQDGADDFVLPPELMGRAEDPELAALIASERRVFEARRDARKGQKNQLRERVEQVREQIDGLGQQASAKADEIALIRDELVGVMDLFRKQLVPVNRVTTLKREETRLRGERGALVSSIAQSRSRISETEMQVLQIDQELRSEVSRELREIQAKIAELTERRIAAEDQLRRIDIVAPQDGVVHQLAVHTVGGVVMAGEPVMLVVPEADDLTIEAKVAPTDIDQVHMGQLAVLRLSAFNQRTTPEIRARVSLVPADLVTDQRSGAQYFPVRLTIDPAEAELLGELKLMPGMPVECFIQTGARTVFSYVAKPFHDQVKRAFRHD